MLPVFFIVLSSAAVLGALAALFASLRASLGASNDEALAGAGTTDVGALEDEKNALLRALKDLEYEHQVGKIDDEDYARLDRAYRARAKDVLAELDRDLKPYLSRAEALAGAPAERATKADKKAKKKKGKAAKQEGVAVEPSAVEPSAVEPASPPPAAAPPVQAAPTEADEDDEPESDDEATARAQVCPKCATQNDADARFCKKCATPLAASEEASS